MTMTHVDDELLDDYIMQTLSPLQVEEVEEHLLVCEQCQERLDAISDFVQSISAAASNLQCQELPPIPRVHTVST